MRAQLKAVATFGEIDGTRGVCDDGGLEAPNFGRNMIHRESVVVRKEIPVRIQKVNHESFEADQGIELACQCRTLVLCDDGCFLSATPLSLSSAAEGRRLGEH